ncbi:leucyl aminopeptidase [Elysia marginata]|uniref:Leucyl aminopeptidase n=1 Tax=Elysia marginata TaxID=1093978 RepID=A0AAV4JTC2_9GAST|nr:leucyl aminopeptidase [Elysia marginata]
MKSIYGAEKVEARYEEWYDSIMTEDSLYTTYSMIDTHYIYLHHRNLYDPFNFRKGALLLKMLEERVSEDSMQKALQDMLAEDDHLELGRTFFDRVFESQSTDTASLDDVYKDFFGTFWFDLRGYPVITVALDNSTVQFSQERFLTNRAKWRQRHIDDRYNF